MVEELAKKKCVACEGGVDPLGEEEIKEYLSKVSGWNLVEKEIKKIEKEFQLKNFKEALSFINKIGEIAEQEGHHPDITLYNYNKVKVTIYTHSIKGLHENDFILAAKIDAIKL